MFQPTNPTVIDSAPGLIFERNESLPLQIHVDDICMTIELIQYMLWAVVSSGAVLLLLLANLAEKKSRWKQMGEEIAAWRHQTILENFQVQVEKEQLHNNHNYWDACLSASQYLERRVLGSC